MAEAIDRLLHEMANISSLGAIDAELGTLIVVQKEVSGSVFFLFSTFLLTETLMKSTEKVVPDPGLIPG